MTPGWTMRCGVKQAKASTPLMSLAGKLLLLSFLYQCFAPIGFHITAMNIAMMITVR